LHCAHLALSSRRLAGTRFRAEHDAQATSMPARCARLSVSQGTPGVPSADCRTRSNEGRRGRGAVLRRVAVPRGALHGQRARSFVAPTTPLITHLKSRAQRLIARGERAARVGSLGASPEREP
jgi:hypothetical protein